MRDTQLLDPLPNLPCVNLPLVHEYVDGTLDPATHRRVAAHLSGCEMCDGERAFVLELRSQAAGMPRLAPPDHLWDAIATALGAASEDSDDDGEADVIPQWGAGTFGAEVEPPARRARRAPRWQGWAAGLSLSAAAVAVLAPSLVTHMRSPLVANRAATGRTQATASSLTPTGPTGGEVALAPATAAADHARPASARSTTVAHSTSPTRGPLQTASTGSTGQAVGNPLLSTSGSGFDGVVISGVSLDRSSGSWQVQEAELSLEHEKLLVAQAAINSCEAALRDNPNDARINLEYKRALGTKEHALQVIMAARRANTHDPVAPEAYPVSWEPAGSPREHRW